MTGPSPHAFRDRIVELRRVRAGDLLEHPRNWRRHPKRQVEALRAILGEIGFSAALIAREEDGRLILIDGVSDVAKICSSRRLVKRTTDTWGYETVKSDGL